MNWQPIETAPKDGTEILVYTHCDTIEITAWYQMHVADYEDTGNGLFRKVHKLCHEGWNSNTPTHWMPLPAPPSSAPGAHKEQV